MCSIYVEQVDLDYPQVCHLLLSQTGLHQQAHYPQVVLELEVLVLSTPATGASFSSCPMLELVGSK